MSKIDLLNQQWIDLVFEGKNEAYGAYQLRKNTSNRNLMAILGLIAGIIALQRDICLLDIGTLEDHLAVRHDGRVAVFINR